MGALKLLIADSNEDFRLALARELQQRYYVRCCSTGSEALELLRREKPDIFVLDLMLPEIDGMMLLEQIVEEDIRPMVLVVSSMVTDYVYNAASRLGIAYAIRKPCQISAVAARVQDLKYCLKPVIRKPEPLELARRLLDSLEVQQSYQGYNCLLCAIVMMARNPKQAVTKELYPAVAKVCSCTAGHVERNIRNAIEQTWPRRNAQVWAQYFPDCKKHPSNKQFIRVMAEVLQKELE